LVQTQRHFFPDLNAWFDRLPDTRDPDAITYETRFLVWWGLSLYLYQLGSRRQLDFELDSRGTQVLRNLNRLAQTQQRTRPVHDTFDHFLEHSRPGAFAELCQKLIRRLVRMKVLDSARLLGYQVFAPDGTGHLSFGHKHCDHCLTQKRRQATVYLHQVLEAKLLGPAGVALSLGSAFLRNADAGCGDAEQRKQDCELAALSRLAPRIKQAFPQARLCLSGDNLYACGRTFQICKDYNWRYVITFKEGRMPAVWREFQALLRLCPAQVVVLTTPRGIRQEYRWVEGLSYTDDQGRPWTFQALQCLETGGPEPRRFAWLTDFPVNRDTVIAIATKGGREHWRIENEGFNRQKNSGLNLEHIFSSDENKLQAYYYLLQIAHIILQLLERGSLLRALAERFGRTPLQLFGSLKNIARRLVESVRYCVWSDACYDPSAAARLRVSLDSS